MVWYDEPDRSTPVDAAHLNQYSADLAASAAAADASAAAAAASAALAVAPTDAAMAAAVGNPASATRVSLSSTFARQIGSGVARFVARAVAGQSLKIVGVGDSVTAGTGATLGTNDFLTLVRNAVAAKFPTATITQSNRGISGTTVATIAIGGTFASAITDAGDLYVIMFGKNDTVADAYGVPVQGYKLPQSMRGLEVMIREIRRKVPKADIIVAAENPNAAADTTGCANLILWDTPARNLAAAYGCEWVDCYAPFIAKGDYSTYLFDGVHPSVTGHQLISDTIMASIPASATLTTAAGRPSVDAGVYTVTDIDATTGFNGWVLPIAPGAIQNGSWVNSGTWSGSNPYQTTTATDYCEFQFVGTEVMARFSTASGDALVVDITIDGVLTWTNLAMTTVVSTFSPFNLLAGGLTAGSHKVRVTLKSGTMKLYQVSWLTAAVVAGNPSPIFRRYMSGRYYGQEPYVPVTNPPAAGTAYLVPIFIPTAKGFNQIAIDVTTLAAASTINLGLYGSNEYDQPYGLIADYGTVDSTTTGFKTITISALLTPGWYWLAALPLGGAPAVRCNNVSHPLVTTGAASTANALNSYVKTGLSALPSVWESSPTASGVGPRILLCTS
jgi:lysophospholipase L1-like esterase